MTVEELIAELCEFQPELEVYVRGYEGGIDDIVQVSHVLVHRGKHVDEDMYGDHAVYEPEPQFEESWQIEADRGRSRPTPGGPCTECNCSASARGRRSSRWEKRGDE